VEGQGWVGGVGGGWGGRGVVVRGTTDRREHKQATLIC
jgi:hypothetical protein